MSCKNQLTNQRGATTDSEDRTLYRWLNSLLLRSNVFIVFFFNVNKLTFNIRVFSRIYCTREDSENKSLAKTTTSTVRERKRAI